MKKILTISIAAYNVEEYLEKSLDSLIIDEILKDIEVIVVNDGSTDNTAQVAEKYAVAYPETVKVINKKNGGHGSTINAGIKNASGEYFTLLDGDDWFDSTQLKEFINKLKGIDSDIIACNFNTVNEKTSEITTNKFVNIDYYKIYDFSSLPKTQTIGLSAMTIKTEILKNNNIQIDENSFYVDMEYITYPIPYVNTIMFLPITLYQYRVNQINQSINIKMMLKHADNHYNVCLHLLNFLEKINECNVDTEKQEYIRQVVNEILVTEYSLLLKMPIGNEVKKSIEQFTSIIIEKSPKSILKINEVMWINCLIKSKFKLYRLESIIMKFKSKINK